MLRRESKEYIKKLKFANRRNITICDGHLPFFLLFDLMVSTIKVHKALSGFVIFDSDNAT